MRQIEAGGSTKDGCFAALDGWRAMPQAETPRNQLKALRASLMTTLPWLDTLYRTWTRRLSPQQKASQNSSPPSLRPLQKALCRG